MKPIVHHVASVSGGRTSAYLVHLLEKKRKTEGWDVTYVYMDTGAEHPATYAFLRNIVDTWMVNLICQQVWNPVCRIAVLHQPNED